MTPDPAPFAALADTSRLRLVEHLQVHATASTSQLSTVLSVSRQATRKHLAVLERARLVTHQKVGRERLRRLDLALSPASSNGRATCEPPGPNGSTAWMPFLKNRSDP